MRKRHRFQSFTRKSSNAMGNWQVLSWNYEIFEFNLIRRLFIFTIRFNSKSPHGFIFPKISITKNKFSWNVTPWFYRSSSFFLFDDFDLQINRFHLTVSKKKIKIPRRYLLKKYEFTIVSYHLIPIDLNENSVSPFSSWCSTTLIAQLRSTRSLEKFIRPGYRVALEIVQRYWTNDDD